MSLFKTTTNPKERLVIDVSETIARLSVVFEKLTKPVQIIFSLKDENLFFVMGRYYKTSSDGVNFKIVKINEPKDIDKYRYIVTSETTVVDINALKEEKHKFGTKEDIYTNWLQLIKVAIMDYIAEKFPLFSYPDDFIRRVDFKASVPTRNSIKRIGHHFVEPGEITISGNTYISNEVELYQDIFPDLFHRIDAFVGEDVWNEYIISVDVKANVLSIVIDKKEDLRVVDFHLRLSDSFNQYKDEQDRKDDDESQRLYIGERRVVYEHRLYTSSIDFSMFPTISIPD